MIREMQKEDMNRIMDIWLTATVKAHPFVDEKYWTKHYRTVKNKFLHSAHVYVTIEEDVIVGFISIQEDGVIDGLYIIPGRQKHHIGTQLLTYCKEHFTTLQAHVYEKNKAAAHFYRKNGFEAVDMQKNLDSNFEEYTLEWKA